MKNKKYESKKAAVTKKIENIDTKDLEDELLSKKMYDIPVVFDENENKIVDEVTRSEFSNYVKDIIKQKGYKYKDVIYRACLKESNGRHIIGGQVNYRQRDTIIKICIAGEFDLLETNRALKLCGLAPLYAKDKRDAIIIIAINNKKYDVMQINDLLIENNLKGFDMK